ASVCFVYSWCRITTSGQLVFPQYFAGLFINGPELFVSRCGYKNQSSRSYTATAKKLSAGFRNSLLHQLGVLPKGSFPNILSGVQITCVERSPRWLNTGISKLIFQLCISFDLIFFFRC